MSMKRKLAEGDALSTSPKQSKSEVVVALINTRSMIGFDTENLERTISAASQTETMVGDEMTRLCHVYLRTALNYIQAASKSVEESRTRSDEMKLFQLPDLVLRHIFKYLSLSDLKKLRLISLECDRVVKYLVPQFHTTWKIDLRKQGNGRLVHLTWFLESDISLSLQLPSRDQIEKMKTSNMIQYEDLLQLLNTVYRRVCEMRGDATSLAQVIDINKFRLKHLHITKCSVGDTPDMLKLVAAYTDIMATLSFSNTHFGLFKDMKTEMKAVKRIEVSSSTRLYGFNTLLIRCPNVVHLHLEKVYVDRDFPRHLPNIKTLIVVDCKGHKNGKTRLFEACASTLTNMKILNFDLRWVLPLSHIRFSKVRHLELGSDYSYSVEEEDNIRSILRGCCTTSLKVLILHESVSELKDSVPCYLKLHHTDKDNSGNQRNHYFKL